MGSEGGTDNIGFVSEHRHLQQEERNPESLNSRQKIQLEPYESSIRNDQTDNNICDDQSDKEKDTSILSFFPFIIKRKHKFKQWKRWLNIGVLLSLVLIYVAYFISVAIIDSYIEDEDFWCDGDGLLYIITSIVVFFLIYFQIIKRYWGEHIQSSAKTLNKAFDSVWNIRYLPIIIYVGILGGVLAFIIVDALDEPERMISLLGVVFLLSFGFLFSANPRRIRWRHTAWALGIQFSMALIVLRWPTGKNIVDCLADKVVIFLNFTKAGSSFVFGLLVSEYDLFAFSVMPVVLFFSFCTSLLYYYGAIQWIVIKLGWLVQVSVGTTLCESVNAVANVFLGMTEAPLIIKPYIGQMTNSELHAVMTGGFASVAGSNLAAYIRNGANPTDLLTACVMNAPASLGISKLFYPEIEKSRIDESTIKSIRSEEVNALHAASVGVSNAIPLVANIVANLITFIAFLEFINAIIDWSCQLLDQPEGTCSLEVGFGYVFMPLAWMMGVKWEDCYYVGELLGIKTIVNEFVAYERLGELIQEGVLSPRSISIATFALCGFSNISSIGIQIGGLSPMAPHRKGDLARLVVRAMIAGVVTNFLTASIAGMLISSDDIDILTTTMSPSNMTSPSPTEIPPLKLFRLARWINEN